MRQASAIEVRTPGRRLECGRPRPPPEGRRRLPVPGVGSPRARRPGKALLRRRPVQREHHAHRGPDGDDGVRGQARGKQVGESVSEAVLS